MGDQVADRLNLKEIQGPVELSKSHNEKAFGKGIGLLPRLKMRSVLENTQRK